MTKREVTQMAIERRSPPHVPWQVDVTDGIGAMLERHYGATDCLTARVGNHLVRQKNKNHKFLDERHFIDLFGVPWLKEVSGDIGVVVKNLLPEPEFGDYALPEPDAALIGGKCRDLIENHPGEYRVFEFGFSLFERAWTLRGMENLLTDMLLEPEFVESLFERLFEYNMKGIQIAAGYDIDAIMFGDDWGQQKGLIMGAPLWRKWIKPHMARLFAEVKRHGKKVILHCCGDILEIMGELVDMGLDVYNTFQPEVYDMAAFKREYGDHIAVYGGISTQGVLARGTPAEVREAARRALEVLGADGHYIAAPTHQIPAGTPLPNILALIEALQDQ